MILFCFSLPHSWLSFIFCPSPIGLTNAIIYYICPSITSIFSILLFDDTFIWLLFYLFIFGKSLSNIQQYPMHAFYMITRNLSIIGFLNKFRNVIIFFTENLIFIFCVLITVSWHLRVLYENILIFWGLF